MRGAVPVRWPVCLPEALGIRDEEVGVGWVAVATRHFDRTGAVPGGWKEDKIKRDSAVRTPVGHSRWKIIASRRQGEALLKTDYLKASAFTRNALLKPSTEPVPPN